MASRRPAGAKPEGYPEAHVASFHSTVSTGPPPGAVGQTVMIPTPSPVVGTAHHHWQKASTVQRAGQLFAHADHAGTAMTNVPSRSEALVPVMDAGSLSLAQGGAPTPPKAESNPTASRPNSSPDLKSPKQATRKTDEAGKVKDGDEGEGKKKEKEDPEKEKSRLMEQILQKDEEVAALVPEVRGLRARRLYEVSELEDRLKDLERKVLHSTLAPQEDERHAQISAKKAQEKTGPPPWERLRSREELHPPEPPGTARDSDPNQGHSLEGLSGAVDEDDAESLEGLPPGARVVGYRPFIEGGAQHPDVAAQAAQVRTVSVEEAEIFDTAYPFRPSTLVATRLNGIYPTNRPPAAVLTTTNLGRVRRTGLPDHMGTWPAYPLFPRSYKVVTQSNASQHPVQEPLEKLYPSVIEAQMHQPRYVAAHRVPSGTAPRVKHHGTFSTGLANVFKSLA